MVKNAKFKISIKVIKSLTVFLSFLLLLPLHFAFAEIRNQTSDNQHIVNDDTNHQSEANQSTELLASPPVTSVKPNTPSEDEALAYEMRCQKDFITWKSCVQVRIKNFFRRVLSIEETEGGVVTIRFKYDEEGTITDVKVLRSSGDEKLSQYALALFQRMKTIPKPINGGGTLTVPLSFPKVEKKQSGDETIDDKAARDPSSEKW
ncbi:energy transducer TonB [Bartonella sp. HY329]|uniref:energy transducer TonB family protein n=1 Tax=unclassified Bartonella TaxID=2645622 RepID=UPI0021C85974|nr:MULTISPECIES: energy transducer TonB [unclassified Bartonella]UXM95576.1 energy transducer TonB [Bartonella sp. HY329]UXN09901.1 energy transducer TonB [Bartonella sp. HY328]